MSEETKKVTLYQQKDQEGNPVAPLVPERGIYDEEGVRLDDKLKIVNLKRVDDAIASGIDTIKKEGDIQVAEVQNQLPTLKHQIGLDKYKKFNNSTNYQVGDVVLREDRLYKYKVAHEAGAWNYHEVIEISIIEDIDSKNVSFNSTGTNLNTNNVQDSLYQIYKILSSNYKFMGFANLDTNPINTKEACYYITNTPGTYSNFKSSSTLTIPTGVWVILKDYNKDTWVGKPLIRILNDFGNSTDMTISQDYITKTLGQCIPYEKQITHTKFHNRTYIYTGLTESYSAIVTLLHCEDISYGVDVVYQDNTRHSIKVYLNKPLILHNIKSLECYVFKSFTEWDDNESHIGTWQIGLLPTGWASNLKLDEVEKDEIEETVPLSLIGGGYFMNLILTPYSGTGYYQSKIDISKYDKLIIKFGNTTTLSQRETYITDKDDNILKVINQKGINSVEFTLNDKSSKYLYVSSVGNDIKVYGYIYSNKVILKNLQSITDNPLKSLYNLPKYLPIFDKITCIGDSLTEGYFNTSSSSGVVKKEYSYPSNLQKLTGCNVINLGLSGCIASRYDNNGSVSVRSYYDSANKMTWWDDQTNFGDMVILELGTNDIATLGSFTGRVSTDISSEDRDHNGKTSVGGYANIIMRLKEINPKIIIFCVGIPNDRNDTETRTEANLKIKEITEYFDNCYFLDMQTYAEASFEDLSNFLYLYKNYSHNNALGYNLRARQYIAYIDYIIAHNLAKFKEFNP